MAIRVVNTPAVRIRRWIAATMLATVALVVAPQAFAQGSSEGPATDTHVVSQGETLWQIAQEITPAGDDVRETVAVIKSMNMMESATIEVGEQLLIPLRG